MPVVLFQYEYFNWLFCSFSLISHYKQTNIKNMIQRSFIADSQILHLDVPIPTSFVRKEINLFLYAHD